MRNTFKIATILCHWCQVSCTDAHYLLRGVHVCTQGVFVHFHKSSSRAAKIACHRAFKDFHFSENSLLGSLPPLLMILMLSFKRLIQLDWELKLPKRLKQVTDFVLTDTLQKIYQNISSSEGISATKVIAKCINVLFDKLRRKSVDLGIVLPHTIEDDAQLFGVKVFRN